MKELEYAQSVPKDKRFCTICGEIKRLHYFEGDSTHCLACCEKMRHTHVRAWSVPVVLVLLLAVAAAVVLALQTVPFCKEIRKADAAAADKRLYDACDLYAAAIAETETRGQALLPFLKDKGGSLFEAGVRTWEKYASVYAQTNSEYEAASMVQSALNKGQIARYPTLAALDEARDAYDKTLAYVQALNEKFDLDDPKSAQYDELMQALQEYADNSKSRYIKGYTAYYQATAAAYFRSDDPTAAIEYYDRMLQYLPDEYLTVYTAKGNAALQAKDYAAVIEAYEAILQKNSNYEQGYVAIAEAATRLSDTEKAEAALEKLSGNEAYYYRVSLYLAMMRDDLPGAQKLQKKAREALDEKADGVFNEMLANQTIGQTDKKFLISYIDYAAIDAAVSLLADDADEAFRMGYDKGFNYAYYLAYIAGDYDAMTQGLINIATLSASLTKNDEALQTIAQVGECNEATQKVIDGKLTAHDVFVEGKADIL
ncbi:MAG: hypothetical protein IJT44_12945 [Clostridia bacterium]|nr:hypothetical protein [Clostridia bacterium]